MTKKERERFQLERFKAVFSAFPAGTIMNGKDDGSEPDFFVAEGQREVLGIELTELYRTPEPNKRPLQADESDRRQIVELACSMHEQNGGPPLDVSVHLSMNQEWSKKSVRDLAPKLAQLVSDNLPSEGQHVWVQNSWNDPNYFPYEIDSISIMRYASLTQAHWVCPEASFMPELSEHDLQRAIDRKNDRVSFYRQKVGAGDLWLMIIHGLALSSTFDRAPDALKHEYHSEFTRPFFFNWFEQTYVELRTRPENSAQSG